MANTRRAPFISHATSPDLTPVQINSSASGSGSSSASHMGNGNAHVNGYYSGVNGVGSSGNPSTGNGKGKEVAGRANGVSVNSHGYLPNGNSYYNPSSTDSSHKYGPSTTGRRPSIQHPTPLPFSHHNSSSFSLPGGHSRRTDLTSPRPPTSQPPFQSTLSRLLSSPLPTPSTSKFIILCFCWYGTSALSSNTGKVILNNFRFPVTLTIVQFFFVAGYCWLFTEGKKVFGRTLGLMFNRVLGARALTGAGSGGSGGGGMRLRSPSRAILGSTWPMAMFQVGGHIFASMAMSRVKVSTVHTIKVSRAQKSLIKQLRFDSAKPSAISCFPGLIPSLHRPCLRLPLRHLLLPRNLHLPPPPYPRRHARQLSRHVRLERPRPHLRLWINTRIRLSEYRLQETHAFCDGGA